MERLKPAPSGQTLVMFASEIGRAHGEWVGAVPEVNSEYEVEVDIPGILSWGEQINVTERATPALLEAEGHTLVFGRLQSFDGKVAEVCLADDLILVEVDRVECRLPCNVVLAARQLRIFDANL